MTKAKGRCTPGIHSHRQKPCSLLSWKEPLLLQPGWGAAPCPPEVPTPPPALEELWGCLPQACPLTRPGVPRGRPSHLFTRSREAALGLRPFLEGPGLGGAAPTSEAQLCGVTSSLLAAGNQQPRHCQGHWGISMVTILAAGTLAPGVRPRLGVKLASRS